MNKADTDITNFTHSLMAHAIHSLINRVYSYKRIISNWNKPSIIAWWALF